MCYSAEVAAAVGTTIVASTAYAAWRHVWPRPEAGAGGAGSSRGRAPADVGRLRAFQVRVLLAYLCIGGHQFAETVAMSAGSEVVYKVGLCLSLSCMFFLMSALESLTGRRYGGREFLAVCALIWLSIFTRSTPYENRHFWVRGYAHALWGLAWTALFFHWNLCVLHASRAEAARSPANARLLRRFPWAVLNVSWVLALVYSHVAAVSADSRTVGSLWDGLGMGRVVQGFNLLQDTPSIWCAFSGLQSFFIPPFLGAMNRAYGLPAAAEAQGPEGKAAPGPTAQRVPEESPLRGGVRRAAVALAGCAVLYVLYPLVHAVSAKMLLK